MRSKLGDAVGGSAPIAQRWRKEERAPLELIGRADGAVKKGPQ
jgi:hypothetical protein